MIDKFTDMMRHDVSLNFANDLGPLDLSAHSTGIGGVHPMAMPEAVVEGMKQIKPGLIRIFLQEFFFIYNDDGSFDWSRLDPYMDAVAATGAKIMASICIKPHALYPVVDEDIFMPDDIEKWQYIVAELVKRYSVDRDYVSHWSVLNETNIGEYGGCAHHITTPEDFYDFYKITIPPILKTAPHCQVGGPSYAGGFESAAKYIGRFAELCEQNGTQLDFVNYNAYLDDPAAHVRSGKLVREAISGLKKYIDLYITELNVGIGGEVSIEEHPYTAKRAASLAATVLGLYEAGDVTGTFQYHIYDQFCDPRLFAPFYAIHRYMAYHWNDEPHRLGLFDLDGRPRPQFHMYDMLCKLKGQRYSVTAKCDHLHMIGSRVGDDAMRVMISNYMTQGGQDCVLNFAAADMPEGIYRMTVTRIDDEQVYETTTLKPVEVRTTYVHKDYKCSVYAPKDCVILVEWVKQPE